uniref:C-type lectin domain-containing protein n=1 Tax=Paramormyrops kingsleyae TaxID=1676925 RepID=A0A3B3QT50_9TELE
MPELVWNSAVTGSTERHCFPLKTSLLVSCLSACIVLGYSSRCIVVSCAVYNKSTDLAYKDGINATWNFTLIDQCMNWSAAQNYCRHSYTDLATVRNKEDNDLIHAMFQKHTRPWIGLFRDTWGWSDLSNSSFRNWNIGKNNENHENDENKACALAQVSLNGTWTITPCDKKHPFVCYDGELYFARMPMSHLGSTFTFNI